MMNNITDVVKNLLILNVIVFVGVSLTSQTSGINIAQYFTLYFPASDFFKPVQLVTHMFMHGSISHLLFNMLGLFFLGPYVEKRMGAQRFLLFYLTCGFIASAAHMGISYFDYKEAIELATKFPTDQVDKLLETGMFYENVISREQAGILVSGLKGGVVGASGAIMGVVVAFAMFFPNMKLMLLFPPIPVKAKFLALGYIAIDLFSGFSGQQTGIAHFAHLGGALAGFILVTMWYGNPFKK